MTKEACFMFDCVPFRYLLNTACNAIRAAEIVLVSSTLLSPGSFDTRKDIFRISILYSQCCTFYVVVPYM